MTLCLFWGMGQLWLLSIAWHDRNFAWLVTLFFIPPSALVYAIIEKEARKPLWLTLLLPLAVVVIAAFSPAFRADPEGELLRALALEEDRAPAPPKPRAPRPVVAPADERPPDIAATYCRVRSTPAGAPVWLDGKPTGQVTPAKLTLYAGRDNVVSVRLKGFVPTSENISPNLNQNTERDYTLAPGTPMGVRSVPQGAKVLVDGQEVLAQTPGEVEGVPYGEHEVVLRKKGMADVIVQVTAKEEKPLSLDLTLYAEARVRVKSLPTHAEVTMDGRPTGEFTPAVVVVSSEEPHVFEVRHPKYLPATLKVSPVPPGELEEVTIPLELSTVQTVSERIGETEERLQKQAAERARLVAKLAAAKKRGKPEADTLESELTRRERTLSSTKADLAELKTVLEVLTKRRD